MALTPEEQKELARLDKMAPYPGPISAYAIKYAPQNKETSLLKYAQGEGLNKNELSAFMAQVSHESNGFRNLEEIGGGKDTYSGGKDYKGRGYIQLTHDYNYKNMGNKIGVDLLNNPELAADPEIAKRIAVQWWKDNVRPSVKDWNDVYSHSRLVNYPNATGPEQIKGYDERVAEFQKYQKQLRPVIVEVKGGLFKIPAIQVPEVLNDWPEARVVPSSTNIASERKRQGQ